MKVLVIGDVILDEYTYGTKRGLSAETPTIVANFTRKESFVGGAGLVTRNLIRLGNYTTLVTVGDKNLTRVMESSSDQLSFDELLSSRFIVLPLSGWIFSEKKRFFVDKYKLLQYDVINEGKWSQNDENDFIELCYAHITNNDAIVLSDNRHGLFSEKIVKKIISFCKRKKKPVYVDSQVSQSVSNHEWYKGANYIFLNDVESHKVAQKTKGKGSELEKVRKFLRSDIVYKRGERGAVLQSNTVKISNGIKVNAVDTCGAGDAFLAAFVSSKNDLDFANQWAALSTTYYGTVVPKLEDFKRMQDGKAST